MQWHTVTKAVNVPLNHSEKKTPLIWPYLHANSQDEGGDAASGVKAAADAQGQWAELVDQAAAGLKAAAYPLCPILLSRNLIHAGCRVLFPVTADNQTGPQAVTALGLEHLKVASAALSKCLGFWESERIHDDIGCNLLPASLVWARAMLHWFQWQLQVAGCISPRDIEDPRLRHSVSGWPEGPALPHGPRAICGRLLVAQAMSLSDPGCPEPLTALVPATTALARLLVGQGRVFGTGERPKHTGIVPLEPVAPQASDTRQHTIRVLHVKAGSTLAFRVASSHLVGALRHIRVAGNAIKGIGNIRSISEVGDSETLWEAVSLHHAIERLLKLPGIIEGQGTCGGRMYRVARNAAGDASLDYNVYT